MVKQFKKFEIWSAVGTIIFGSLLHFVFDWSGKIKAVALVAAVNESTWEHLKLAFWPALIFAVIAYFVFGRQERNFCFAQAMKLFIMPLLIVLLFYGWLVIFPGNFIYDIAIFVLSVIVGHIIAYHLEISQLKSNKALACVIVLLLLYMFSTFTYFPPKNFLFQDPISGNYGID